jgi:hypothetical protein
VYPRGAVASSPVRHGATDQKSVTDPLRSFLERSSEPYPGVVRNIFRMEVPAAQTKPVVPVAPVVVTAPPSVGPEKTAEEIAADLVRADLVKFRYLGYLTDKETTVFLSKDGELFIAKSGEKVGATYKIKEANRDFVVIVDVATHVEGRVAMTGDGAQQQQPQAAGRALSAPPLPSSPAQPGQQRISQPEPPKPQQPEQQNPANWNQKRRQRPVAQPAPGQAAP